VIHLSTYAFDHVAYDPDGDVLYMSIGEPRPAANAVETPEGHAVRLDDSREVIGVTIVNAKWWLEQEGEIKVSFPGTAAIADRQEIEAAIAA
jgi:uncharacterized protein YuzE